MKVEMEELMEPVLAEEFTRSHRPMMEAIRVAVREELEASQANGTLSSNQVKFDYGLSEDHTDLVRAITSKIDLQTIRDKAAEPEAHTSRCKARGTQPPSQGESMLNHHLILFPAALLLATLSLAACLAMLPETHRSSS